MSRFRCESRLASSRSVTLVVSVWLALAGGSTGANDAGRRPSGLVPAEGLTTYLEYDGLDAHADAWKATSASRILNETSAGEVLVGVSRRTLDRLMGMVPGGAITGGDLVALQDHLTHSGFAMASYEEGGFTSTIYLLIGFDRPGALDRFHRLLRFVLQTGEGDFPPPPVRVRGRDVREARPPASPLTGFGVGNALPGPAWWIEGDTLIWLGVPALGPDPAPPGPDPSRKDPLAWRKARVEAVLDAIEGRTPGASTHPAVIAARAEGADLGGFEPTGLFAAVPSRGGEVLDDLRARHSWPRRTAGGTPTELDLAEAMGLGRAGRIIGRWGFRGKALLTDVRFEAAGPWDGVLGMLDSLGFGKDALPPLPRQIGAFAVGSIRGALDPGSAARLRENLKPEYRPYLEAAETFGAVEKNRRAIQDVLARLGPTWSVHAAPGGMGGEEGLPVCRVGVPDIEAFGRSLDSAVLLINAHLREREFGKDTSPKPDGPKPSLAIDRLPAPERGYRVTSPSGRIPWLTDGFQPTLLLGKSSVVLAPTPAPARAVVASESEVGRRWEPPAESADLFECLPARLSWLAVGDPRDSSWPEAIVNLSGSAAPFLGKLVGADLGDAPGGAPPAGAGTPKAADLRALIFPSVFAGSVDDRGARLLALEALPLGCAWLHIEFRGDGTLKPAEIQLKFGPAR